jgi:hypothetical protein
MKINIITFTITLGLSSVATLIIVAALGLSATPATAQDGNGGPRFGPGPGGPGGPRQAPPLIAALDANKDGKLDASEIANASAALKTLDKNNDGELTADELGGPRGERGGPGGGPGQRPGAPPQ